MASLADRIMKRMRARGRGRWVCIPKDFLDLGSRSAIDQALSRLAKSGDLRRVGRGFYDLPRMSAFMKRPAPPDMDSAIAALVRRDGIRVMPDGIVAANQLALTNAVPAKAAYVTDGATRTVKIGGRTLHLRHAGPSVMSWTGRPSAPVAQALRWLGPYAAMDPRVTKTLKRILPDKVKKDLVRNSANLPAWAVPIAQSVADDAGKLGNSPGAASEAGIGISAVPFILRQGSRILRQEGRSRRREARRRARGRGANPSS